MKQPIPHTTFKKILAGITLSMLFFLLSANRVVGQEIVINKVAVENGTICNQFDVTLEVIGNPPPRPQEVVLIIDRSGSMDDGPVPEPIDFAQEAAIDFIEEFFDPANNPTGLNKIAIVSYAASASLDQGLTLSSGEASLIATVNAITTGGATNIAQAIQTADNELINNGTFDCATSRSIIVLTDGVANRDSNGDSCSSTATSSDCIDDAIAAGIAAQTTTVGGEVYNNNVFSIGLVGAISGSQQTTALNTLDALQNGGFFFTEDNADLSGIYNVILGQLVAAATQLPGQSLVTDILDGNFVFVPGSFVASKGSATITGQQVDWFVDQVVDETITLEYSMVSAASDVCGVNSSGPAVINYEDSNCQIASQIFNNPDICVPCPTISASIERDGCTEDIIYTGTFDEGECASLSDDFSWEFFLNDVLVGTANTLSGTFTYTGTEPFVGEVRGELTYDGTYGSGCVLDPLLADSSITIPLPPEVTAVVTDVLCFGDTTGSIDITVTDGTPPYTFLWNTGATTEDLSGLAAGSYTVTVTDADGCNNITTTGIIVEQPDEPVTINGDVTDVACFGESTGAIDVTVSGGTPPYTYAWDNGATTEDISGLVAGTYELTVTDDNGCSGAVETFTVEQPDAGISVTGVVTDVACFGESTGAIDATISGGTPPYTLTWTTGSNDEDISGLTAGTYRLSVEDANGCMFDSENFVVGQPDAALSAGITAQTNIVCGETLGSVTVTASNGTAPYTYSVDGGAFGSSGTFSDLAAGDHTVDVEDANGCTTSVPVFVINSCIAIVKTGVFVDGDGDACADDGESIDYTFVVTNQGNVAISSVDVTDPLVGTITFASGDTDGDSELDIDETWTYTGSYTINQDDVDLGTVTNQATANGSTSDTAVSDLSDESSVLEDDPTVTALCQGADIAIVKTGVFVDGNGDDCADDGESIDYTFVVTNQGNVSLSAISVTDPLVGAITFVDGDTDGDGELDVDETWTYTGSYTITQDDIDNGSVTNQALAQGTAPDTTVVEDESDDNSVLEDDPTVTELCQDPAIAIVKTGIFVDGNADDCADDGESIDYTFVVTNQGNVSLSAISVTDPLVGAITFVDGDTDGDGELDVDETWTYTGSYVITQDDIDNGSVTNQAIAQGTAPDTTVVEDESDDNSVLEDDPTVTPLCSDAAIAIVKTGVFVDGNGDDCADDGESIDYTFVVTNQGNVSLSAISVTDPLVGAITFVDGDTDGDGELDVDETWTYTGSYVITQDDIDNGSVTNQAIAQGTAPDTTVVEDESDDNSVLEDDPTVTPLCSDAAIAIVKTGVFVDGNGDDCADDGESIDYTFVVTNQGNVSLSAISVTDPLVGAITFVDGDTDGDGELDVDETWTYTGSYTITQDDIDNGSVTNQALAQGTAPDTTVVEDESDDNSVLEDDPTVTPLCSDAAIAIVKTGVFVDGNGDDCADDGESIDYTFVVTNQGNVSLAAISVTDPLVGVITFVDGDTDGDGELDVDETWTYTGSYVITQDDIDNGSVTNQALAQGTAPDTTVVEDESDDNSVLEDDPTVTPLCSDAAIAIVKTGVFVDGNGDDCADDGESIDYTFVVTNQGNVSLSAISVTDPLVGAITFVDGDTDGDGELDVDETWTYTGSYTITQDDIDNGSVTNQALAQGTAPDTTVVEDESDDNSVLEDDPTVTPLCSDAAIAIVKTGVFVDGNGDDCADDGESIDYTFVVTNQGNVSLSAISVTDPLVGAITFVDGDTDGDGELDVDETWTYTGSYVITQDDIDNGSVTNQALAQGTAPDTTVVEDESDDNSVLEDDPTVTELCQDAAIAIVKTGVFVDGNGDDCADDGESIDYTFVVTNQGNVSLSAISVTDPLVGAITFVDGDTDGDGELDVDETWTYTGSYVITQDDIDNGSVTNQAIAQGTAPDTTVVEDESDDNSVLEDDPTVTPLCSDAAIAIVKTGVFVDGNGDDCADDGESIDYTFVVTNQGNVSLSAISVTDPLVGAITFVSGDTDGDGELDVDETWTYTGSYVITQDDIDNGSVTNQAIAQGTAPDTTVVEDESDDNSVLEDDPTVTPLCNGAAIAIVKTGVFVDGNGDDCADDGESIDYTFVVTNQGNVSLSAISVTDPLVGAITFVDGDTDGDGELDVDETWTYTGSYVITQDDIDNGSVTNQALAQGTAPDTTVVEDESDDNSVLEDDPTVTPLCSDAAIAIVKTGVFVDGNGDDCADDGESIDYTFVVTNQGNVSLSAISVTDPLVGAITFVDGDTDGDGELDVDETWTYTGSYVITQDDIDNGSVTNQAIAQGTAPDTTVVEDESDDNSVLEDDPTVTELCQDAAIAIVKTGVFVDGNGDDCADDGESIDYTFVVTNQGNVSLSAISVTDPLVGVITFQSGDTDSDGELDVTETWTYTGSYVITQDDIDNGSVTNQAIAQGTAPDTTVVEDESDDNSVLEDDPTVTELCQEPAIAIVKTGVFVDGNGDDCADDGESIDYTFVVTNQGNVSLAAISVTDPLVGAITFVDGDTDGDGELDVDETWTYTGSYTITQDDIDAGEVVNQATATGTAPDDTEVTDLSGTTVDTDDPTVTELCQDPAIAIVKTGIFVDGNGDDCADDGETIEYTFTVTNEGNVSLSDITVTDPLVGTITFVGGDTDGDGELDVDETWTYTGSYVITQDDIDAGEVVNQATATGTAPDDTEVTDLSGTTVDTDDPTVTELCQDPGIAIVKTGVFVDGNGDDCADDGETINYTFVVTNQGNVSLSAINVTDPLVGTITFVDGDTDGDGELDVDETWTYTGSYVITQDDIDNGSVTNQALAQGTAPDTTVVEDESDDNSVLEDDPTVTPLCSDAAIAIVKTGIFVDGNGDDCADDGETIEYTFTVTNEGNVSLSGITVTDPLVGAITFVDGDTDGDGELDVDETWTYTGSYTITQDDIDAGEVVNQATATGIAPDDTEVTDLSGTTVDTDDPTVTELCQDPAIAIVKTGVFVDGNADDCADDGESIDYTFTVTNEGNVSLSDITVTDPLVGTITFVGGDTDGDGELDVDETWTYTGSYVITQDDIDAGEVVNQATATGIAPDDTEVTDLSGTTVDTDDPTVTELCQDPAIAIVKTGIFVDGNGDDCADDGETIEYTFTVTNEGNVSLSDITVTDPLVGTITFVGGDTDGDGELDVDETWTYTGSYVITQDDIDAGEVVNQATATGIAPDDTEVTDLSGTTVDTDDPTVTELCQDPAIAIVKTGVFVDGNGDDCADDGETINYTFVVTNQGNVSLSAISVTDPLVGAITFVDGDTDGDGELDVDETWTYTGSYVITQDDIDAGEVVNQATATGIAPDDTEVTDLSGTTVDTDDPTVTELCQDPAIAIVKTGVFVDGNGDDCADDGETIEYTFTVTNEGNVSLSDITVTDPLVGTITFVGGDTDGDGELDVDETWTYTGSYTITQDDIDAGEVVNQATATGIAPDDTEVTDLSGTTVDTDDPTVTELCQDPAIAIVKTGVFVDGNADDCADDGETIEYTFTVTNEGNVSLSDITVTDPLVGTITFVGGDTDGDGELDVDETWTYTGSYVITQDDIDAGEVVNQATATGIAPDDTEVTDLSGTTVDTDDPTVTELCQDPAIAIVKTGVFVDGNADDCADDGETIEYTFTVTNEGNVSLSDITVTDPLVGTITFVGGDTDGDGELDVDETWTYTGSYVITQDDIDAGEVVNQATATGIAPDDTEVTDLSGTTVDTDDPTVTELCQDPAIAIVKTGVFVDGNGDDCADDGETIEYTFTVTNEGNVSLSDITVTDPLVGTITFVGGDTDGDGELDVDETWTYTGSYTITQDDIDAGEVVNQATATGIAPDDTEVTDLSGTTVDTDDPTVTELCQDPAIAIVKTGVFVDGNADDCADDGETIEYTFTVTNEGNVSLSDITVTDPLVGTITFVGGDTDGDGELDVDETWTYTGSYVITQDDIDAGEVVNQATATGIAPDDTEVTDLSGTTVDTDDPTVTELCQEPSIALIKQFTEVDENEDGCADEGETILYNFIVKNTGNTVLTNVTITDPLVAVDGGPITLEPGEEDSTTFTAVYTITAGDITIADNGDQITIVTNQAIAEGTAPDGTIVDDLSDDDSFDEDDPTVFDVECGALGPFEELSMSVEKSGVFDDNNGDGEPQEGETITYVFTVTNTGTVPITNITITDPLVEVIGGPIDLEPGEVDDSSFTAVYEITEDDIEAGQVVNQAIATGEYFEFFVEDESDDPNDPTNVDNNGDGEPDDPTVVILPEVEGAEFEIFNAVSPGDDNRNDFFRIVGIEQFPDNNMQIYNRWGVLVYETDGYGGMDGETNVFRGVSEGRATIRESKLLPTGTYYYILRRFVEGETLTNAGYLYINRQ